MEHRRTRHLVGGKMTIHAAWYMFLLSLVGPILFHFPPALAQECPLLFSPTDVAPSMAYDYSSPAFKSLFASLNSTISSYVSQHGITKYSVAIVHQNRTIFTSGLTRTKFRIASISKTFTALGAFMLRSQARLSLDDPVKKFLPSFTIINPFGDNHDTTLRELMGHAAGFPQQLCPFLMTCTDNETEILQQISGMQLISPPWSEFPAYSNLGISLLGRAWEKATVPSMSWEEFVTENILKPLQMSDSGVNVSGVDLAPNNNLWALQDLGWSAPAAQIINNLPFTKLKFPEKPGDGRPNTSRVLDLKNPFSHTHFGMLDKVCEEIDQMYSTAHDLTKYLSFLLNAEPPLISQNSIREWTSPATIFTDGMGGYSFPWELYKLYENSTDFLISKAGNINGYVSHLVFDPPTEVGVVVLSVIEASISSGSADELAGNVMRTLVPAVESVNQQMIADVYAGVYTCRKSNVFVAPTLNYSVLVKQGTIKVYVSPTVGLLANVSIDLFNAGEPITTAGTWGLLLKNATENSFWFGDGSSCSGIVGSVSSGPDLMNPNTPGSLYTDVVQFDTVKGSLQWPAVAGTCYKSGSETHKPRLHLPFYATIVFSFVMIVFAY